MDVPLLTTTVLAGGFTFPEAPRWRNGLLWFSDIFGNKVRTVDLQGNVTEVAIIAKGASGIGFLPDGTPLVTSMRRKVVLRLGVAPVPYADLNGLLGHHINDMVVGANGNAYVGVNSGDSLDGVPKSGYIALVPVRAAPRLVADGLNNPNAMVISADGKTLYIAETYGRRISAYDILPDGGLENPRMHVDLRELTPDGICLDAEGCFWVGTVWTGGFVRVRPDGVVTHRVATPGKWAVAPMLGGEDGKTLFLCTAQTTLSELRRMGRAGGKSEGWIETVRVETPHAGWP